ncbi:hypothetical protein BU23DRAFT_627973 [Bimuria novae-zelandiae CBS 107.79]|uniref:F-box domain-containing protein n=1 Tax=Bimuria novae-zelandiae CBS 107.79 TaxID=1447943 RepID=A0A6A5VIN0_9PLEO|nr:hypothetical protein BU23DRAFT_627973 [Bimuria novae-zelandiae CBS 107.79]
MDQKCTSRCPSLPPEIWIRILTYNTDLNHLWTVCRNVSTHFRAYTEQVFAESVIRNTHIDFHLEKYNQGGKSKRPEVPTSFARFALGIKLENGEREKTLVCFQDHRRKSDIAGGRKKDYDRIMERWESNVNEWKPQMPNYTIRVDNIVNDTELPGLDINIAMRQIQFDWRHAESEDIMKKNKERLTKGERLAADDYPTSRAAAEEETRKQIRRKRLREYYAGDERMLWAVGSLEHFEKHSALHSSSKAFKLNPDLPGTGIGEKYFGSVNLVQELYLDEWSCMHRIDTKVEHLKDEEEFTRYSVPPPDLKKE